MAVLVISEHDNETMKPATLITVAAAAKLGSDVAVIASNGG